MTRSSLLRATGLFTAAALLASASGMAIAAPAGVAGLSGASAPAPIVDVRARGRARRGNSGAPVGAVLGLFGAALGAAIATDRYNDYSYRSYGYPGGYGYGYAPGYGVAPSYGFGNQFY